MQLEWKFILIFCTSCLSKSVKNNYLTSEGGLNLSPLIEKGDVNKARTLSEVDPTLFAGVKSHSAYINVNKAKDWNLFFWLFPVDKKHIKSAPWIIWLQGGPGVSSLFGLFEEMGPIQYSNGEVVKRPITWGSDYTLLFIDNPAGSGFSYTGSGEYAHNEGMIGEALLRFIEQFLQVFPELQEAPLFIAGESYAGKYVPTFGHYIHNSNNSVSINLKGLAIGNGWTDPPNQALHYSELGFQTGFLDIKKAEILKDFENMGQNFRKHGDMEKFYEMDAREFKLFRNISNVQYIYNYLDDYKDIFATEYIQFITRKDVREAIHVGHHEYYAINLHVYAALGGDFYKSCKPWLEELLERYGVMCYSGQLDIIVAHAFSMHMFDNLEWSGVKAYRKARKQPIKDENGNVIGIIKEAGHFSDVVVRNAGHMAPGDQPKAAKQIIDMFINKFK